MTSLQQNVFFVVLLLTALATAFLIAPSAHHRVLWRRNMTEERLRSANRFTIAGLACLVPAMTGAVFLVSDVIFGSVLVGAALGVLTLLFVYPWFVQPLWRYGHED